MASDVADIAAGDAFDPSTGKKTSAGASNPPTPKSKSASGAPTAISKPGKNVGDMSWKPRSSHQYTPWGRGRSPRWRSTAYSSNLGYAPTFSGSIGMNPDIIFFAGIALIVVANSQNGVLRDIYEMVSHGTKNDIKADLAVLGSELAFVFVLSLIARTSSDASNMIAALIFGLWLVWGVVNAQRIQDFSNSITTNTKKVTTEKHNVSTPKK